MKRLIEILKTRWGVTNGWVVFVILTVFALSGFSTLYTHRFIDGLLGIGKEDPFWIKLLVFIIIILPVFNMFLYIWGFILGQRIFFTLFIKTKIKLFSGGKLFKDI